MARKKYVKTYNYTCEITGEKFTTTKVAAKPDDLMSVKAWYEMHPDKDDRPEVVKQRLEREFVEQPTDAEDEESGPESE